jgi:hypothetical protein
MLGFEAKTRIYGENPPVPQCMHISSVVCLRYAYLHLHILLYVYIYLIQHHQSNVIEHSASWGTKHLTSIRSINTEGQVSFYHAELCQCDSHAIKYRVTVVLLHQSICSKCVSSMTSDEELQSIVYHVWQKSVITTLPGLHHTHNSPPMRAIANNSNTAQEPLQVCCCVIVKRLGDV